MMGYVSQDGYGHVASKAARGDKFCGLLLDEINQDDLTDDRVKKWVAQLLEEDILDAGVSLQSSGSSLDNISTEKSVLSSSSSTDLASKHSIPSETAGSFPAQMNNEAGSVDITSKILLDLEKENKILRATLERNSYQIEAIIGSEDTDFTPHYNPKTGSTMWTSLDGRKCYFTSN